MKTSMFKGKEAGPLASARAIDTARLAGDSEQIGQRAQAIYRARGGRMMMTLNDWLKAEQELKRELSEQTPSTHNPERSYENDEF
jgi:hypothetical protein